MFNFFVPEKFQNDVGKLIEAFTPLLTQERLLKMEQAALQRSRHVCLVFENTHHAHNISAVLRTTDALGFLDVSFLYNNNDIKFRTHDAIDRSSSKWLLVRSFQSIEDISKELRDNGYKIALISRPDFSRTSQYYRSDLKSFSTNQFNSPEFLNTVQNHKIALVFGTELYGLSEPWSLYADFYIFVEMYGFCESLNVSVCAGIILNSLRETFTANKALQTLSESERTLLMEHWIAKHTPHAFEYINNKHPNLLLWYKFLKNLLK